MARVNIKDIESALKNVQNQLTNIISDYDKMLTNLVKDSKTISDNLKGVTKGTSKELIEVNKALESQIKINKELEKTRALKAKTQTELNKTEQQQIKINQELEKQTQQSLKTEREEIKNKDLLIKRSINETKEKERLLQVERKIQKQEEKDLKEEEKKIEQSKELERAYVQQSKKLNDLRKIQKDLNTKNKLGVKLNRDQKRTLLQITKEVKKLDKALKDVDEEAGQFQRKVGEYPKTLGKASQSLVKMAAAAGAATLSFEGVKSALESTDESSKDLAEATSTIGAAFDVAKNAAAGLFLDLKNLVSLDKDEIINLANDYNGLSKAFVKTSKNGKNLVDDFTSIQEADAKAAIGTINFRDELRGLNSEVAKLSISIQEQLAIAGDSTKSFDQIAESAEKAATLEALRISKLVNIAEREKKIIDDQLKAREGTALKNNALLDAQAEKELELINLRGELSLQQIEINKIIQENERDRYEIELDFAIDAFDTVKSINERRISDERLTLNEREKILKDTIDLTNSSFESQKQLTEEFTKQKLNLDELVLISDEKVIRSKLKNVVTDEKVLTRLLEIIKERKIAIQDLTDAEIELQEVREAEDLSLQQIQQQEKEIQLLNDTLDKKVKSEEEYNEKVSELNIENLEEQKDLIEEQSKEFIDGSTKKIEKIKEINDIEIELLKLKLEEEAKKEKKEEESLKRREKITEESLTFLGDLYQKFQDNQIKSIDSEINQSEKRLNRLNDAVNAGVKGSAQALAQEEARREKLEQDKREAEKRRVRTEAFIAGAKLLVQNDGDIISTASDINTLETIAGSLAGFKDGTDNTGYKSTGVYDSQGEVMGVVHKGETVLTEGQRKELSRYGINNRSEIVQMAKENNKNKETFVVNSNNKEAVSELREVRKEIKKLNKEIKVTTNIDPKYVTSIIEREKWKESNRKKANIW